MSGIPPELHQPLQKILIKCHHFETDTTLQTVFANAFIHQWGDAVPEASNRRARVDLLIGYLNGKQNDKRENALVLFLHVLAEDTPPTDALHNELLQVAQAFEDSIQRSTSPPPPPPTSPRFPFRGLDSLGVTDSHIFFGRDQEIKLLSNRIQDNPIIIVNGLSGCGKSSLIKAGVMPRLFELGYEVVFTSVHYDIIEDLCRNIGAGDVSHDWVEALRELQPSREKPIVLVVDQFERALDSSHNKESLLKFLKGLPLLASDPYRFARVVIVVRADWQYNLRRSIEEFYPYLNPYCIIDIDPLRIGAAREAIEGPLKQQGFSYDETVIDKIIGDLKNRIDVLPASNEYVQPIQLQIVLSELYNSAYKKGEPETALSSANYEYSEGVEYILQHYLTKTIGSDPETWRVLSLFIASDNKSRKTRHHSELLDVPAAKDIEKSIERLVDKRVLVVQEIDEGDKFYDLAHDYLIAEVVEYLNGKSEELLGLRRAEDWLREGTDEWRRDHQFLLERNRYLKIYQEGERLGLSGEARQLLILSALDYGHEGIGYWLSRGSQEDSEVKLVAERLLDTDLKTQRAARNSLATCKRAKSPTVELNSEFIDLLHLKMLSILNSSQSKTEKVATAQALWTLQAFESRSEHRKVNSIVFKHWVSNHATQLILYLLTITLTLTLVFSGIYIRDALQGTWETIQSLRAGGVIRVATDPVDPNKVYAIALGGPGPHEGLSLFVGQSGSWEMLSRDFSGAFPNSVLLTHNDGQLDIYLALVSSGIARSSDQGKTWNYLNSGLPSRDLTSIVADPDNPNMLYVGTQDWRGVLRSQNRGDSWEFFDYHGEIYGARISQLVFTRANGGALIAGTTDGRILMHPRTSTEWLLQYSLSKGGITNFSVASSDENFIYAGTNRGIMLRSSNGGQTWDVLGQIDHKFSISDIAVSPKDPNQVYAITYGEGGYTLWGSEDAGENWEKIPGIGLPCAGTGSLKFTPTEPFSLIAGTTEGLFISYDNGEHWDRVNLSAPLASIQQIILGNNSSAPIYALTGGSVYSNLDGRLETWIYGQGLRAQRVREVIVDPYDPMTAYAGVLLLGEWSVFKTQDGGQNWQQTTAPVIEPIVPDTTTFAVAKTENGRTILYAGTTGCGIFRSEDGGENWETFGRSHCSDIIENMPTDVMNLAIDAGDPYTVYVASGYRFYRSTDGGRTWESFNLGDLGINSTIYGFTTDPVIPGVIYLITRSDGFWRSEDSGYTWEMMNSHWFEDTAPTALTVFEGKTKHLVAGAANGEVWISTNGGYSWHSIRQNLAISSISSIASSTGLNGKILVSTQADGIAVYKPGRLFDTSEEVSQNVEQP